MERARDGSRRKCKDIHILLKLLDLFFVRHAEPLLFVDDEQTQVLVNHILREHPVCADDDIHKPLLQILHCLLLLIRGAEPAQKIDADREILQPLYKCIIMLLGEDGGRHQIDHLLSLLDRLKCSADGDLCLAVPHISADQPVHDLRALHIMLRVLNGLELIFRLLEGKHLLKLLLPDCIRPIDEPFRLLPGRIELHQVLRHSLHCLLHLTLRLPPLGGPEFVQLRLLRVRPCILLDQIHLRHRDIEGAAFCIGDLHIVLRDLIHFHLLDALIDPKSMILMDYIISGLEFCKVLDPLSLVCTAPFLLFLFSSEDIRLRDHDELQHGILISFRHISAGHHDLSRIDLTLHILAVEAAQVIVSQILCQTLRPCP